MIRILRNVFAVSFFLMLGLVSLSAQEENAANTDEFGDGFHTLGPGDIVRITVFNEPELAVSQKLDPRGVLVVPLLGRTQLSGMSMREAEKYLESRFIEEEYLVQPQITVSIADYSEQVFYIYGEVRSSGAKVFPEGRQSIDILEAITMAGDLTQYAKRSDILIRRPVEGSEEEETITVDLDDIIRGKQRGRVDLAKVYPGDRIFVPERLF